jgi:hypothetical protein
MSTRAYNILGVTAYSHNIYRMSPHHMYGWTWQKTPGFLVQRYPFRSPYSLIGSEVELLDGE